MVHFEEIFLIMFKQFYFIVREITGSKVSKVLLTISHWCSAPCFFFLLADVCSSLISAKASLMSVA